MRKLISYEDQVKKIYPEAYVYMPEHFDIYVVKDKLKGIEIAKSYFKEDAWESAYDKLKEKGLL